MTEHQNGSRDINRHVDEEDRQKVMLFDGNQDKATIIINESGLYALIFGSKLESAKRFRHWIISVVLTQIHNKSSNPSVSNEICIYKNNLFGEMRIVPTNDSGWFCLSDVCKALKLSQPSKVRERLNPKGVRNIPTLTKGGIQNLLYINESNLYKTIFQSRKPSAEQFTDWVTSEVLPSIRKHGGYIMGQEQMTDEELLSRALQVANSKIQERDRQIAQMQPLADFAHHVHESDDLIDMGTMAQYLCDHGFQIGRNTLFQKLRELKVLKSNNMPYQNQLNLKRFVVKEYIKSTTRGAHLIHQTCVTGKGQRYIYNLLVKQAQS